MSTTLMTRPILHIASRFHPSRLKFGTILSHQLFRHILGQTQQFNPFGLRVRPVLIPPQCAPCRARLLTRLLPWWQIRDEPSLADQTTLQTWWLADTNLERLFAREFLKHKTTVCKRNYFTRLIPYFTASKFCNSNTWTTVCSIFCTNFR